MNKTFEFTYCVMDSKRNKVVTNSSISVVFDDFEYKKIADAMIENGGFPVELEEIEELDNQLWDTALNDFTDKHGEDEDVDFDDITLELTSGLPTEAIKEAERFADYKNVFLPYYFTEDGKEKREFLENGMSNDIFYKMVELAQEEHEGMTDMEYLKSVAPEMYNIVFYDADVWANNLHLAQEEKQVKIELREFPYQVYEAM